jgi:hypothetical protein
VRFGENFVENCSVSLEGFTTVSLNEGLLIEWNQFNLKYGDIGGSLINLNSPIGSIEDVYFSLNLTNTPGVRVGWNFFGTSTQSIGNPVPIPNWRNGGIYLHNVSDAQIKANTLDSCNVGIYAKKDLIGTIFSCNYFVENYIGMYIDSATVSSHGDMNHHPNNQFINSFLFNLRIRNLELPLTSLPTSDYFVPFSIQGNLTANPNISVGVQRLPFGNTQWSVITTSQSTSWVPSCNQLNKNYIGENTLQFHAWPNPVVDFLTISALNTKKFNLIVYNLQGVEMLRLTSNNEDKIDLSSLETGIYFIVITDANELKSGKLKLIKI